MNDKKSLSSQKENPTHNWKSVLRNAKPFLKWAGGKQQLLAQFDNYFPDDIKRYIEPFVGGGAVFFHLWNSNLIPDGVQLIDNNEELINAYSVVRDKLPELFELLSVHQRNHSRDYYYEIRSLDRDPDLTMSDIERAARMIYLNRTCYNGLYRVNSKGQFNVPMGSYKNPTILHEETLKAANAALQGVCLETADFESALEVAEGGDFIYFDPPYDPISKTSSFTSYTADNFGDEDQRRLAGTYTELSKRGCYCMLSNSSTPFIHELYEEFRIEIVKASRAINSKANGRGAIDEVLVLNY